MEACEHEWVLGPFYVKVAVTWEEPTYYPPQGLVNVEHCAKCGLLRLPESAKRARGSQMNDDAMSLRHPEAEEEPR